MSLCYKSQNLLKKDMPYSTLVDEPELLFLDMAVNISIAVFKRYSFTVASTCKQVGQRHQ